MIQEESPIITEITPLEVQDTFYLAERRKAAFDYPIHKHQEIEINFLEGCQGARRVVGDNIEQVSSRTCTDRAWSTPGNSMSARASGYMRLPFSSRPIC